MKRVDWAVISGSGPRVREGNFMQRSTQRGFLAAVVSLALLPLTTGCGPSVGVVQVSGTLLADGEPVPGLTVQFSPADGSRPSVGFTDETGRFVLRYNKDTYGVLPGPQQVTFSWSQDQPGQKPTPIQALVLARHDHARGTPLDLVIDGVEKDLVIAINADETPVGQSR